MLMDLSTITLVLGGARSGKSLFAEQLAQQHCPQPIYIATAQCFAEDAEMRARINSHRQRRGKHWTSVEEPIELAAAINRSPNQPRN